jgi:hypothetical protein
LKDLFDFKATTCAQRASSYLLIYCPELTQLQIQDNVFIISNPKSKYPVLQLDLRLISDLVVVIVSATFGGIAFACLGQPVITGYLLAGSIIGPGGFSFVSEMVQVRCFFLCWLLFSKYVCAFAQLFDFFSYQLNRNCFSIGNLLCTWREIYTA